MNGLIKETGIQSFFRNMSDGVLVMASLFFVAVLGLDLLLPDPLPLIDEFVLFLMTFGGTRELSRRYKAKRLDSPKGRALANPEIPTVTRAAAEVRGLAARADKLAASTGDLSEPWAAGAAAELRALALDVRRMNDDLRGHEAFLARTRNDPWQVDRQLARLDRRVVGLEAEGDLGGLKEACVERDEVRAHRQGIEGRIGQRERVVASMERLTRQVDLLSEDLRRLVTGSFDGTWAVAGGGDIEPRIRAVMVEILAARDAEAEVEETVRERLHPRSLARAGRVTAGSSA